MGFGVSAVVQPRPDRHRRRRRLRGRLRRRQLHRRPRLLRLHTVFGERLRVSTLVERRRRSTADQWSAALGGEQWSVGFSGKLIYASSSISTTSDTGRDGATSPRPASAVGARRFGRLVGRRLLLPARRAPAAASTTSTASRRYGVGATYDLGGGARSRAASARSARRRPTPTTTASTVADFGIGDGVLIPDNGTVRAERRASARLFVFVGRHRMSPEPASLCGRPGAGRLGGCAAAQEIALFGEARLGLGYNIDNEGERDRRRCACARSPRSTFGVDMAGETEGGIVFGAEVLADDAEGGEGGDDRPERGGGVRLRRVRHAELRRHRRRRRACASAT